MKPQVSEIVGKHIVGVVTAESDGTPRTQAFLLFSDGTRFEFHGERFSCCAGLDKAAGVLRYIASAGAKVTRRFGQVESPAGELLPASLSGGSGNSANLRESLESLLARDLAAWNAARAAIERARRR